MILNTQLIIYNNGQRVAITNMLFDAVIKKELMREWTLNFSVLNSDNARQYVIDPDAIFEIEGQKYDTKGYKQNSGKDNITNVTAYHVLTRTNNYTVPINYTFTGTIHDIIQNILTVSGASAEFTVGNCTNISGTYILSNSQPVSVFVAVSSLVSFGIEPEFDNFIINAPIRSGTDTGKVFSFGRDLCSLDRTFDKTTTPYTYSYEIDIANLQRIQGGSPTDTFIVGDTVGIQDELIGDSIMSQRIISYEKNLDDPTKDKVTIGQFISDMSDAVNAIQSDISDVSAKADEVKVEISAANDHIALKASKATLVSEINVCPETIKINTSKLDITGLVTISGLSGGLTEIDGGCIRTGRIESANGDWWLDLENGTCYLSNGTFKGTINFGTDGYLKQDATTGKIMLYGGTDGSGIEINGGNGGIRLKTGVSWTECDDLSCTSLTVNGNNVPSGYTGNIGLTLSNGSTRTIHFDNGILTNNNA